MTPIKLKEITKDDLEFVKNLRNKNKDKFFSKMHFTSAGQERWWAAYETQRGTEQSDFTYIIWLDDITRVGMVAIYNIDWCMKDAEIGRTLLDIQYRGKGYMLEAMTQLLDLVKSWSLKTLRLEVYAENEEAIRLYERIGFVAHDKPVLKMGMTL